jgi:hypothetical protein
MNIREFLKEENIQKLLEEDELDKVYYEFTKRVSLTEVADLTMFLLNMGINPLDYMSFVAPFMFVGLEIRNIDMSNNITEISARAFAFCNELKEIVIPNSVHSIGRRAFQNCQSLTYVTLPNNLKGMEIDIFKNSPNVIIRCGEGTLGELYAKENKIPYEII